MEPATNYYLYDTSHYQGNYIPTSDEGVGSQEPEYDIILALSLTKWVHLNWGDAGLKRLFQRVFHHLRPGGRFILEPQPFSSYARKKKLTVGRWRGREHLQEPLGGACHWLIEVVAAGAWGVCHWCRQPHAWASEGLRASYNP